MSVTAIRRFDRTEALEQLRHDPTLAKASLSSLAKRWGVARSTARAWVQAAPSGAAAATTMVTKALGTNALVTQASTTDDLATNALTAAAEALPPAPVTPAAPAPIVATALAVLPTVAAASAIEPAARAAERRGESAANLLAYGTAASLAAVAAYFSVSGMAEIFPGAPVAVIAFAGTMELAKLVTAGWLARQWRTVGVPSRIVLITLIAGLAAINAAGVYGRLVEAHVGATVAAQSSIAERTEALDARIDAQSKTLATLDQRLAEIDAAIAKLTEHGRASAALAAIASQRTLRDTLSVSRGKEMAVLIELRVNHAKLEAERSRVEAARGPVVYMAAMLGLPLEATVRWLILLMVLTCDPTAIALTVAAARRA